MRALIFALALCMSFPTFAAERTLQTAGSRIAFAFKQMNVSMDGSFKKFSGKINFDAAKPETSSIEMLVDIASISIYEEADPEVIKPIWLNAAAFPQARFVSKNVKALGGGRYQATGTLSIKGASREVTVPFEYKEQGANAIVDGQFTLKRGDYKIGEGEWSAVDIVANDVLVKFHLVVAPAAATKR
ncbi:YceI family protein [Stenotrophobium rhamnosiphilum]|uniref:Polyisoprenoid-binding protein n=1 Tax=Stenotrophobium rhamnosiphilum TaxID=2029166 RepID=A0A2T5MDS7_9GAMM|nr:YceI family protein [Stenotrophobium rhamnosiphilum]PTU30735.1 polyisoprenoid-binding protein [Stenotrophobium rhamnosiphilum]